MRRRLPPLALLSLLVLGACQRDPAPPPQPPPDAPSAAPRPANDTPAGQRIEADVRALADDAMEGRETGTAGHDRAAAYVAGRFADIGLVPAGDDGGWFQRVPLVSASRIDDGARLTVRRSGRAIDLRLHDQFLPAASPVHASAAVEAPAVFVAHAIHAPEQGHDDFAGLDLSGRIAVVLADAPDAFDAAQRGWHGALRVKADAVAARGAVGMVVLSTPAHAARVPWEFFRRQAAKPAMALVDPDGGIVDVRPELAVVATVNAAAADLLLADTGRTAAALFDAARSGDARGFALPGTIALAARSRIGRGETRNVIGRLPGSDPARAAEHVVHTAHLDHVGIGEAVDGDAIHNGALDNALGVAIMLETARTLAADGAPPKRPTLFVATAAEEQGLLGSHWFVRHAGADRAPVANINIDMPVLTAPTADIVAIGVEHSSLRQAADAAAAALDVALSPDPFPEEAAFMRSDQFSFVRAGIPALYLTQGTAAANPEQDPKLALAWFLRHCYHKPCDDLALPVHYGDAARLAAFAAGIGRRVGDAAEPPRWNADGFFGRLPAARR